MIKGDPERSGELGRERDTNCTCGIQPKIVNRVQRPTTPWQLNIRIIEPQPLANLSLPARNLLRTEPNLSLFLRPKEAILELRRGPKWILHVSWVLVAESRLLWPLARRMLQGIKEVLNSPRHDFVVAAANSSGASTACAHRAGHQPHQSRIFC